MSGRLCIHGFLHALPGMLCQRAKNQLLINAICYRCLFSVTSTSRLQFVNCQRRQQSHTPGSSHAGRRKRLSWYLDGKIRHKSSQHDHIRVHTARCGQQKDSEVRPKEASICGLGLTRSSQYAGKHLHTSRYNHGPDEGPRKCPAGRERAKEGQQSQANPASPARSWCDLFVGIDRDMLTVPVPGLSVRASVG